MARSERRKSSRNSILGRQQGTGRGGRAAPPGQSQSPAPDEAEFVGCDQTIYGYMRAFADAGVWETIRHHLVVMLRERDGREPSPSAAIIDTQSVKATEKGGPAATTRPRRSRAGSGTSRSTPAACCSASSSMPPTSKMPMV